MTLVLDKDHFPSVWPRILFTLLPHPASSVYGSPRSLYTMRGLPSCGFYLCGFNPFVLIIEVGYGIISLFSCKFVSILTGEL